MTIFKKGDKVRRIGGDWCKVVSGGIYTVSYVTSFYICLEESQGDRYDPAYFELVKPKYSNAPHTHKDLIIAWANGAEIQVKLSGLWRSITTPMWDAHTEYRIKPEISERDLEIQDIQDQMESLQQRMDNLKDNQ